MPYYPEPCSMYELMLKRQKEGGRVQQECIACRGENPCDFYDKQHERTIRLKNGNGKNGGNDRPKVAVIPGEVERIIGDVAPEPRIFDGSGGV